MCIISFQWLMYADDRWREFVSFFLVISSLGKLVTTSSHVCIYNFLSLQDFNAGLSLYGDKAKPKTFAARFASSDGYYSFLLALLRVTFLSPSAVSLGTTTSICIIQIFMKQTVVNRSFICITQVRGCECYHQAIQPAKNYIPWGWLLIFP